jgi:hypothetical protein
MVKPIREFEDLQNYHHPIVVLGHALGHDTDHLNGKDLGFDVSTIPTIVAHIDTQEIAKQCKVWENTPNYIGLGTLIEKMEVKHTAANVVAPTMMSAILLEIPPATKQGCVRTVNDVAQNLETFTQTNFVLVGGDVNYCCKCGATTHIDEICDATALTCTECVLCRLIHSATTHIALHCPIVRENVRQERLTWYADQGIMRPKVPFSSIHHLQAFGPNARTAAASTQQEVTERRNIYLRQTNPNLPLVPFVWSSSEGFSNAPPGPPRAAAVGRCRTNRD